MRYLFGVMFVVLLAQVNLSNASSLPKPAFAPPSANPVPSSPKLVAETYQRGVFSYHVQQSDGLHGVDDTLGSGVCVFDMDNDGDMDLFFVSGSGATRTFGEKYWWSQQKNVQLYRNDGDGFFTLLEVETGLPDGVWGMGCNSADLNGDGHQDLVITTRGKNWVSFGQGDGRFNTQQLGEGEFWSTSIGLKDINNDGLIDIYIGNYIDFQKNAKALELDSGFTLGNAGFKPERFSAQSNELYINKGNGQFVESSLNFNLQSADGRTLGAKWLYENDDEWVDLLIINDDGSEPQLYVNQEGIEFKRAPLNRQIDSLKGMHASSTLRLEGEIKRPVMAVVSQQGYPMYLLDRNSNEPREMAWDVLDVPDKTESLNSYGVATLDLNADGFDDLYVGAGLLVSDSDAKRLPQGQPDLILMQNSKGILIKAQQPDQINLSTRAVVAADLDNDGDRDLVLTHNNGPAKLIMNYSNPEYWVGLDIRAESGEINRYKKIEVSQGSEVWLYYVDDDGFLSNQDHRKVIVLEDDSAVDVAVYWDDGGVSQYHSIDLNGYLQLYRNEKIVDWHEAAGREGYKGRYLKDYLVWKLKLDKSAFSEVVRDYARLGISEKLAVLKEVQKLDRPKILMAFLEILINDGIYSQEVVEIIKESEMEFSISLLSRLFNFKFDCAVVDVIKTWFIEEEAVLLGKNLFIAPLVRRLMDSDSELQECILYALAESRQYRSVPEIERLLLKSDNVNVKRAAIYSLGRLRHTNSKPLIAGYLHDAELGGDAHYALGLFESGVKVSSTYEYKGGNRVVDVAENSNTSVGCPRISAKHAIELEYRKFSNLLKLCSNRALNDWFLANKVVLEKNIVRAINNPYLSGLHLNLLLENVRYELIKGFDLLLLGALDKSVESSRSKVLLTAMLNFKENKAIRDAARDILISVEAGSGLRIAAGNILIDFEPDLVKKHSKDIFKNEE